MTGHRIAGSESGRPNAAGESSPLGGLKTAPGIQLSGCMITPDTTVTPTGFDRKGHSDRSADTHSATSMASLTIPFESGLVTPSTEQQAALILHPFGIRQAAHTPETGPPTLSPIEATGKPRRSFAPELTERSPGSTEQHVRPSAQRSRLGRFCRHPSNATLGPYADWASETDHHAKPVTRTTRPCSRGN